MAKDADNSSSYTNHLTILIIAVSAAALVVLIYHFTIVCCKGRIRRRPPPAPPQRQQDPPSSSLDASVAELIPAHKYRKSDDCGGGRDNTCAVCLCEFEDGEEIRTLPECGHSFHADCIDMWLYSHFTCPVCRTDNTPSPLVLRRLLECSSSSDRTLGRSMGPNNNLGMQ
ncbi:RING-H2 finger protein ATL1-like [Diospyros lotus]|uniref:RING-H2 finger protein ATL1-like n=1 Tax=Diospyros lotus TaxID=55363 RepID=UPI00225A14BD|nr:RING-H2 finger protein ATL1-like [Diospyros lotus]